MNQTEALRNLVRQCNFGPFLDTSSPQYAALKAAVKSLEEPGVSAEGLLKALKNLSKVTSWQDPAWKAAKEVLAKAEGRAA